MKIGILTYESLYCNFTNYGTVLQAWALVKAVARTDSMYEPVLVDYCPDAMMDKDVMNPIEHMWDTDAESRMMCELSLPAIRVNYQKIKAFYRNRIPVSAFSYTHKNIDTVTKEGIQRFICGSDAIWDIDEFGIDRAFYADYPCMRKHAVAYAASFQDSLPHYEKQELELLIRYLQNFRAVGIRDEKPVPFLTEHLQVPLQRVCDPTMLLQAEDYAGITAPKLEERPYLLYYSRRYDKQMEQFAEHLAGEKGLLIVEISLRAANSSRHRMYYEAGAEEFLSLVRHSEYVITNSFHGILFAMLFEKNFYAFTREHCNHKICELLDRFRLGDRLIQTGRERGLDDIDYSVVREQMEKERAKSLEFLKLQLRILCSDDLLI